ncbi:MAG: four helix bundle protein [Kofleriaceae bacterium]
MLHFRSLDVYKCAVMLLPKAYALAEELDREMANQLRRAALSINLNIAEGTGRFGNDQRKFLVIARGSALECAAVLDAMTALQLQHVSLVESDELIVRIVSMLTKMIA